MIAQNSTSTLTRINFNSYAFASLLMFPDMLKDAANISGSTQWTDILSINVNYITFTGVPTGCTTNCTSYTPKLKWWLNRNPTSMNTDMNCSQTFTSSSAISVTNLPQEVYGANDIIEVVVAYNYVPSLFPSLSGSIILRQANYATPRYVSPLSIESNMAPAHYQTCP